MLKQLIFIRIGRCAEMSVLAENLLSDYNLEHLKEISTATEEKATRFAHRRLTEVFRSAPVIPFDNRTPLVFFSDIHRGICGKTDPFIKNERMYYHVLKHYLEAGFTYVELGDGDEMYKYDLNVIQNHCGQIYQLLHDYNRQGQIVLIAGNHDLSIGHSRQIDKDGIIAHEGVILEDTVSHEQIFAVHGHQSDIFSDHYRSFSRTFVRYFQDPLFSLGIISFDLDGNLCCFGNRPLPKWIANFIECSQDKIEKRIKSWVLNNRQMLICGHIHRYFSSSSVNLPYFNTGSCLIPDLLTGFEIFRGKIEQVRWILEKPLNGGAPRVKRQLVAKPLELATYRS
jgi:UDP-2,3-diacylglucosamine pyrophosphatase LpxH